MEVYEKINYILKQKQVTKRWFAKRLRELEPKLKSTGEIPTEKAIYGYLSGVSSVKIELIPYIAEVLHIDENELFSNDFQYKLKSNVSYVEESSTYGAIDEDIKKLISLLPYAPKPLINKLITELETIKEFSDKI